MPQNAGVFQSERSLRTSHGTNTGGVKKRFQGRKPQRGKEKNNGLRGNPRNYYPKLESFEASVKKKKKKKTGVVTKEKVPREPSSGGQAIFSAGDTQDAQWEEDTRKKEQNDEPDEREGPLRKVGAWPLGVSVRSIEVIRKGGLTGGGPVGGVSEERCFQGGR